MPADTRLSWQTPAAGAGISFLRQPIGASDFSIAHDEARILPLVRQAEKLNPQLRIVASPWSMPGWMKTAAR
jgi:glucosylceramidase